MLRFLSGGLVNRLQKFVEKDAAGTVRIAYAFGADRLPPAQRGRHWKRVSDFKPAEELLAKGDLKAVFKIALTEGCAVIPSDVEQ
jgi:hypothetical protein